NPSVVAIQVGRAVAAAAATRHAQQAVQRRAGRTLAIGAGDGEYQRGRLADTETGSHFGYPSQAHVNLDRVQTLKPPEPGGQIHVVTHRWSPPRSPPPDRLPATADWSAWPGYWPDDRASRDRKSVRVGKERS